MFSGRDQSIGCAVAWVTIARDPESEYPFYLVGQFCRIWAGHLFSLFLKVGRLFDNYFLNHSTVLLTDATEQMLTESKAASNQMYTTSTVWSTSIMCVIASSKTSRLEIQDRRARKPY